MYRLWLGVLAFLTILTVIGAARLARRHALVAGGLALAWIGVLIALWFFSANPAFRVAVLSAWWPASEHVVLGSGGLEVPLPPHSALLFRYSETGAKYLSRLPPEEALSFYEERFGEDLTRVEGEANEIAALIRFGPAEYLVRISGSGKNRSQVWIDEYR